mgnify:CR=1 FL=1
MVDGIFQDIYRWARDIVICNIAQKIKLSEKEKQNMIDNTILIIKIKYGMKLIDFAKIEFEKIIPFLYYKTVR